MKPLPVRLRGMTSLATPRGQLSEEEATITTDKPSASKTFRDPDLQREFSSQGYVRLALLSSDEVIALRTGVAELRPNDGFAPGDDGWRNVTYHCSFLDKNRAYRREAFALISSVFEPHVAQLLAGFAIIQCNFYVKPPGVGAFGLHQNWPATTDLRETTVSVWAPLVDVAAENGAIGVVAGSHKIVPHVQGPTTKAYFAGLEGELVARGMVETLALRAGEAVIFDDSLIHGSPPNLTKDARYAVQLICAPIEAVPAYYRDLGNGVFELVHADAEFWLGHDVQDLNERPAHWRSLGFVKSQNRSLSLEQITDRISNGDELRACGFRLEPVPAPAKQRLGGRLKRLLT